MIRFEVLAPDDVPLAVAALVETAGECPGAFSIGPLSDSQLLKRQVYVTGADEVEAADYLASRFGAWGVRWKAL